MEQNICSTCVYYRQHYTFDQRKIFQVHCGHCTCKKVKRKRPDTKACNDYVQADPQESVFATKEYLSKALLEYMMQLELLPKIYDAKEERKC